MARCKWMHKGIVIDTRRRPVDKRCEVFVDSAGQCFVCNAQVEVRAAQNSGKGINPVPMAPPKPYLASSCHSFEAVTTALDINLGEVLNEKVPIPELFWQSVLTARLVVVLCPTCVVIKNKEMANGNEGGDNSNGDDTATSFLLHMWLHLNGNNNNDNSKTTKSEALTPAERIKKEIILKCSRRLRITRSGVMAPQLRKRAVEPASKSEAAIQLSNELRIRGGGTRKRTRKASSTSSKKSEPKQNGNQTRTTEHSTRPKRTIKQKGGNEKATTTKAGSLSNNQRIICNVCQKSFFSLGTLARHKRTIHDNRLNPIKNLSPIPTGRVACAECREIFPNVASLRRHLQSTHYAIRYDCDPCRLTFLQKQDLDRHILLRHNQDSNPECSTSTGSGGTKSSKK